MDLHLVQQRHLGKLRELLTHWEQLLAFHWFAEGTPDGIELGVPLGSALGLAGGTEGWRAGPGVGRGGGTVEWRVGPGLGGSIAMVGAAVVGLRV